MMSARANSELDSNSPQVEPDVSATGAAETIAATAIPANILAETSIPQNTVARFTGTLDALCVADVIQILQMSEKSGIITVTSLETDSWIWCSEGEIVDAASGNLSGDLAFHRILNLNHGWMTADIRPVSRARTIHSPVQHLLLESARRKDESAICHKRLGGPRMRYRLTTAPSDADEFPLADAERSLLRSFDQAPTVQFAIDASHLGEFESLRLIERWVAMGHLVSMGLAPRIERKRPLTTNRLVPSPAPAPPSKKSPPETLHPLEISETSSTKTRSSRSSWISALVVLALLVPAIVQWVRHRTVEPTPLLATAVAVQPVATLEPPAPAVPYRLALLVVPGFARVSLDGAPATEQPVDVQLPTDGTTHELRITASGYIPTTVIFRDVAPPQEIVLQPLAPPLAAAPAVLPTVLPAVLPPIQAKPRKRRLSGLKASKLKRSGLKRSGLRASKLKRSKLKRSKRRPSKQRPAKPLRSAPHNARARRGAEPRVQVIGATEPTVGVLD